MPKAQSDKIVVLGASTGGVEAIEVVLRSWPSDAPPILIVQHMPGNILEHFVDRLDKYAGPKVTLAFTGQKIERGNVYVAPGGPLHLVVKQSRRGIASQLSPGELVSGHRPSVDVLFESVIPLAERIVAVLLTGMGRDGARGMLSLREAGAWTIAQNRESSVVYGMPAAAVELGGACQVLPLEGIADAALKAAASPIGSGNLQLQQRSLL